MANFRTKHEQLTKKKKKNWLLHTETIGSDNFSESGPGGSTWQSYFLHFKVRVSLRNPSWAGPVLDWEAGSFIGTDPRPRQR